MTAVDPKSYTVRARAPRAQPAQRLAPIPSPWRGWMHEAVDIVTVALNRGLGCLRLTHRVHDRALRRLEFSEVPFPVSGRNRGLAGMRIAFLTDLHAGSYFDEEALARVFERVAEHEPDLICFGGDLVNSRDSELAMLGRPLSSVAPPLGMFAVPGNHDRRWCDDIGGWHDWLEGRGVSVLNNHGVRIERGGSSLWIAGVDDFTDGRPDVERALAGRRDGELTLMLAHQPDQFPRIAEHGVDLTLSGHTHGGQLRFAGWSPITHSSCGYVHGEFERFRSRLYVSRGVGVTVLPLRIGAMPEIPIVRFTPDA